MLDGAGAVEAVIYLGGDDARSQQVGYELVGLGGDVAEAEPARIGRDARVDRLGGLSLERDPKLCVEEATIWALAAASGSTRFFSP